MTFPILLNSLLLLLAKTTKPILYTHPQTRSTLISWYLKELNVPYDEQLVKLETKEQKSAEFLQKNPFGQLPVLEIDDNQTIFESGAILLYLSETYGELRSSKSPSDKADIAKWVFFANASLATKIVQGSGRKNSPGWRIAMTPLLTALENQFRDSLHLVGDSFTAADVAVASLLLYTPVFHPGEYELYKNFPNVVEYMDAMSNRPLYGKAYGEERLEIVRDGIEGYRNPSKAKMKSKGGGWGLF